MRINEGESYESWANRVSMYEKGVALQRIAEGEPLEKVMEDMSRRITQKLLHSVIKAVKDSSADSYNNEESKKRYEEAYLKNRVPVADHVDGNLFDNSK
jgi:glutamyl-tRNA reductase